MSETPKPVSPVVATVASVLVPGLGYWLIGQRKRAAIAGGGVLLMFALGVLIAGIRVISLPGYEDGYKKYIEYQGRNGYVVAVTTTQPAVAVSGSTVTRIGADGKPFTEETTDRPIGPSRWVLLQSPVAQIGENISFLGQVLNGPLCGVAGHLSNMAARAGVAKSYTRLADIGALYTAVSGMLNLMLIVDTWSRASRAADAGRKVSLE